MIFWTLIDLILGETYETDNGLVFVKKNSSSEAYVMFVGELHSLQAIEATKTVRVPKPLLVVPEVRGPGAAIVVEHLQMSPLREHSGRLGELLAQMHCFNGVLGKKKRKNESWIGKDQGLDYIEKFGFDVNTCCGSISQNNEWTDDWLEFFARNKLKQQIDLIQNKEGNRELNELWSLLQIKLNQFFADIKEPIIPALLHGDLWSGNVCQLAEEPAVFDPSSFYGHSEFDLSIAKMFGGFNRAFYECYHNKIPKSSGFDRSDTSRQYILSIDLNDSYVFKNRRNVLYQIFHHLNHWNHFGGHYKQQTLSLMKNCLK